MNFLIIIGFISFTWLDIFDILLVSVLFYQVYHWMRGTIAFRVFLGVLLLYVLFLVVKAAKMELLTIILDQFTGVGVLAIIVLFQPEIRRFFFQLVSTPRLGRFRVVRNILQIFGRPETIALDIEELMGALALLSKERTGALIVLSRSSSLSAFTELGDMINALVSRRLLLAIFQKNGPMHDGAVIIHQNRIVAARCILPVSEKTTLSARFGTRHRAALGISEESDAMVMVVSEERGEITLVYEGEILVDMNIEAVRRLVIAYLQKSA